MRGEGKCAITNTHTSLSLLSELISSNTTLQLLSGCLEREVEDVCSIGSYSSRLGDPLDSEDGGVAGMTL